MQRPGPLHPILTTTLFVSIFVAGGCGSSAPPDSAAEAGDASAVCSLDAPYDFGWSGGLSLSHEEYLLIPPDTFRATRRHLFEQTDATCATRIPACGTPDRIDLGDIRTALDHPNVRDAWEATERVVYGEDLSPVDGGVWSIRREDATDRSARFFLGYDCRGSASCRPIPEGLRAVRELLTSLAEQELAMPACEALGP